MPCRMSLRHLFPLSLLLASLVSSIVLSPDLRVRGHCCSAADDNCDLAAPTAACPTTPPPTTPSPPTTLPPRAAPSCTLQNLDPDHGINQRACICGAFTTLPLLTVPHATNPSQSCAYTALPNSTLPNPISIETQTWTENCEACTLVGGIADAPTCTSVTGCTATTATATATASVGRGGNAMLKRG
ncbi:hypothetical protein EJ04DRAFT_590334 [Polyplosphaeria fusca]|uniref:Uncharacterized protein n=1 Tax=Polyplosphaeria fusca TaxID=682080 RepID=A0A9P4QQ09_9PLEO|nr:hypothetical protein EJ04DRAFT_590334 [Polyplosphaeria fusca]